MKKAMWKVLMLALVLLLSLGNAYAAEEPQAIGILAYPTLSDFGTVTEGEIAAAAQTITIRNMNSREVTLNQPTAAHFTVGALSSTTVAPWQTATFTLAPAENLSAGEYSEKIVVTATDGQSYATVTASVVVEPAPVYAFELLPEAVDFGELTVGYGEQEGVAVTISNTGNQTLTFEKPASSAFVFEGLDGLTLEPGKAADVKVFVTEGLPVGEYEEAIVMEATKTSAVLRAHCVVKPVALPQTGDNTPLAALLILTLCGLTGMLTMGKKQRTTK